MKIAIATPSRGLMHSRTTEAVMANIADIGADFAGWFLTHDLPIPECAEVPAERGLSTGADAVWFVEEDVVPPPGALRELVRLLGDGYAVAAVDYPLQQGVGCLGRDKSGAIEWVGLGCTLISRGAFDAVERPWFRVHRLYGGHDIYFCARVREAGLRIGQVPGMIARHCRLQERGKIGNQGAHSITVLDKIDRQYSEDAPPPPASLGPGVVVLVPRRADNGERDRLWTYCRDWWARTFTAPVIEGHHEASEGPFSRSAALNRAAVAAGDWTVAIIADSDTIPDPALVAQAVTLAGRTHQMVSPFDDRRELAKDETERVLHGQELVQQTGVASSAVVSGAVVVSRALWDAIGGFDEAYVGWGAEDNAFADACEGTGGKPIFLPGKVWHLWHTKSTEAADRSPIYQANRARLFERRRQVADIPGLARSRPLPIGEMTADRIPAILHRVAIGEEPADSARWWKRFAEMHPTWELRSHTLPFRPADWPLTSWAFPHCVHPAQLADLVRLEALWTHGGVYVDWDIEPYRPLDPLLPLEGFVGWALDWIAGNSVMGFRPHHPAVARALELAAQRFVANRSDLVPIGPGAITDACRDRKDVLMLPPQSFYAAGGVHPQPREGEYAATPWVFVVHWGHGSWEPGRNQTAPPADLRVRREERQRARKERHETALRVWKGA